MIVANNNQSKRLPRILFMANNAAFYGANHSLLTILCDLRKKQYDILLLIPGHGDIEQALVENDIPYKVVSYFAQLFYYKWQLKYLSLPLLFLFTLIKFPVILKTANKFCPDIIYSNTSAENVGIFVARYIGCKHITHIREFMQEDYKANFIGGRTAKRKFINWSDGVVFVSRAVAKSVEQGNINTDKFKVIYNGIPCQHVFQAREIGKNINFGVVGILDPAKGQDTAIRYFSKLIKQYPNALLHIWGDKDNSYKRKLHNMVDELSLNENVIFHGYEKDQEVIYENMHVLLMCSKSEGFGRVTIEAMQHCVPVIGYNSGGTPELIKHGENGYLFNDYEEFREAIKNVLSNPEKYQEMCKLAYIFASSSFTDRIYCERIEDYIQDIGDKGTNH